MKKIRDAENSSVALDAWRLALGTFTTIPTSPPHQIDKQRAGLSLIFAPFAFSLWAIGVGLILWVGAEWGLASLPLATLGVAMLVFGNRAFHLDGLADTVDALASSYDRERSLDVARLGNVGPAGVGAIVLVLVLQITAGAVLLEYSYGAWAFAALACLSRFACTSGATRGVKAARADGLGATMAESVPWWATFTVWLGVILTVWTIGYTLGITGPQTVLGALAAGTCVALLVRKCIERLGGIIGDAFGASIEIMFAVLLLGFAF